MSFQWPVVSPASSAGGQPDRPVLLLPVSVSPMQRSPGTGGTVVSARTPTSSSSKTAAYSGGLPSTPTNRFSASPAASASASPARGGNLRFFRASSSPAGGSPKAAFVVAPGPPPTSADQLKSMLWREPRDFVAWNTLAQLLQAQGQLGEFMGFARALCKHDLDAWRAAERVLESRPADLADLLLELWHWSADAGHKHPASLADLCCSLARLQPVQAFAWYERALSVQPLCSTALLRCAEEHRRLRRFAEATMLYRRVASERALPPRDQYYFGEALVMTGQTPDAREYLSRLCYPPGRADVLLQVQAASMVCYSYVLDQSHEGTLSTAKQLETLISRSGASTASDIKAARVLAAWAKLRMGQLENCVSSLAGVANLGLPAGSRQAVSLVCQPVHVSWDEALEALLVLAHTLSGHFVEAERHFQAARGWAGGRPSPDTLACGALCRHLCGDDHAATALLEAALVADASSAICLLRLGQIALGRGEWDRSIRLLDQCLQHGQFAISFGRAEQGACHLYLCIAHHCRALALGLRRCDLVEAARSQFHEAFGLSSDLRAACVTWSAAPPSRGPPACLPLVFGSPPRLGITCCTNEQAEVILRYAEDHGKVPRGTAARLSSAGGPISVLDQRPAEQAVSSGCSIPTLLGTCSTMEPAGIDLSRGTWEAVFVTEDSPRSPLELRAGPLLQYSDLELGELISRGETTTVQRGKLRSTGQDVVVKILNCDASVEHSETSEAAELRAEIEIMASLRHPRIVALVGACWDTQHLALVTERAPGGNLYHALHVRKRQFTRQERFQLGTEFLDGVAFLHSRDPLIAHLDLKTMNLVLDAEGQHLRICDFGLSRPVPAALGDRGEGAGASQERRSVGGSPRYMAPECHDSSLGVVTEKADLWSCGCVLIEMFGGGLPFAECNNVQQIVNQMLVHREGPSISEVLEPAVQSTIACMLRFPGHERTAAQEALAELNRASFAPLSRPRLAWTG